uniref:Uncharacterized protein n=1 Tax=Arundo donax TaxID=35708 RepID=A0A0A9CKP1_ARUDO
MCLLPDVSPVPVRQRHSPVPSTTRVLLFTTRWLPRSYGPGESGEKSCVLAVGKKVDVNL